MQRVGAPVNRAKEAILMGIYCPAYLLVLLLVTVS